MTKQGNLDFLRDHQERVRLKKDCAELIGSFPV